MDPLEGEVSTTPVRYEPTTVKDLLVEMKDTAELLIDLSYSAVLHRNEALASEVIRLEGRMDVLEMRGRMQLMMAARSPDETEELAPVMGIFIAADLIAEAAGDIAKIVLEDIGLPDALRTALPDAAETLVQGELVADSAYVDRTLVDIDLESETGVRVIAIRRGDEWLLNPGPDTELHAADVVFLRGPEEAIEQVYRRMTGAAYEPPGEAPQDVPDLDRAVDTIIHMKNLSELAVDLAYSSVLFDSRALAEEVRNLEVEVDALKSRFEAWTLRAAADAEDPVMLRGLLHLGHSAEVISDAAVDISAGVLRDLGPHPVVQLAVEESDEVLVHTEVETGSEFDGATIVEGIPSTGATMSVIAIRRPAEGWLLVGDRDIEVQPGDILISKGTRTAADAFQDAATG